MKVISYFNKIPNSKFSLESEELIELWKTSWKKHNWNPSILNEEYSKRNKLFHELDLDDPTANFYKTINKQNWTYHRSCYCRLLAYCQYVRENGATLYADYDVMNYGFTPNIMNFATENSYFCGERAVVYLGKEGVKQIENALIQFSSEKFKNEGSSADVYVMERYTTIFIPVLNNLETKAKAKWEYYYMSNSFDKFENDTKLVHYDGGCYRRGASRKLSRLQIIKQHNRL
tara:strand:- start:6130 stop:6822 length:693 start_codon:yes stop_codon:yes gene_type:complete